MKRQHLLWILLFVAGGVYLAYRAVTQHIGSAYVRVVDGAAQSASAWEYAAGGAEFSLSRTAGIWCAALLTLCVFSFLWRDNPFYKLAEAIVVGVTAAYWMVVAFWEVIVPNLIGKLLPSLVQSWAMPGLSAQREEAWWIYLVPLTLGVMLLWRLSPKGAWIGRWPLAFVIGSTAGLRLVGFIQADFLSQIRASIIPLAVFAPQTAADGSPLFDPAGHPIVGFEFWDSLRNIVIVLGVLACLVYFFFSFEHKGWVGRTARVGIWILMITFGAAFGYTVMGRIALLAIRLEFLFDDWLWLIDPTGKRVTAIISMLI